MSSSIFRINNTESVAINGTSNASSTASASSIYRVYTTHNCHVKVGPAAVAVHDDFTISARVELLLNVGVGEAIAVLKDTSSTELWAAGIQEDSSTSSFKDYTAKLNSDAINDVFLFPNGAGVDDAFYFGGVSRYNDIICETGTAGVGTYTITWEYWDGTAWSALAGVTDGTTGFKTAGTETVTFTLPRDWTHKSIFSSGEQYFIRAKRDAGTVTTDPKLSFALPLVAVGEAWISRVNLS